MSFKMMDQTASGGQQKPKKECYTFEPQQWRKSVCKNCFRTQPEHTERPPDAVPAASVTNPNGSHSGQSRVLNRSKNGSNPSNAQMHPEDGQKSSAQNPAQQMTQSAAQGLFSSASSIDARYVEELENDFFELEDKFDNMSREREELSNELSTKLHQIDELQVLIEQYKEKVLAIERRCSHLEEEVKSYRERLRLPESDQAVSGDVVKSSTPIDLSPSTVRGSSFAIDIQTASKEELKKRITYMEQMCHEVAEENDLLKEEIEEMQREIEEMHDHFQEEGRDTMREMQRDLEATNKTCRILQFKLRKAERRFDQCESERANLEERLARLEAELYSEADVAHIRAIEEELRVAKEVGVRLNSELDMLDEKRAYYEEENRQLKEDIQIAYNRRTFLENELSRLKLEMEKLKLEAGSGPLQVVDKNRSRLATEPTLSKKPSFEEQELQRELDATKEREVDLVDQLKFAEDEANKLKRRLQDANADNETLSRRLERLMNATLSSSQPASRSLSPKSSAATTNLLIEKGKHLENDPEKMKDYIDQLKSRLLQVESEHERLELETKNLKAIAQSAVDSTKALRIPQKDSEMMKKDEDVQRERLREWSRRLNQIERDINLIAKIEKETNWLSKYNDAKESIADLEEEKIRNKKRITELQNENSYLKSQQRKFEQSQRKERDRISSKENASKMSNELLIQEINNLEEELDEVTSELVTAREQANSLTLQNNSLENNLSDMREESMKRERELITHISSQEIKIGALMSLNGLIKQRADELQKEFDKLNGFSDNDKKTTRTAETEGDEHLRLKIKTLESQLKETSKISELIESLKKRTEINVDNTDPSVRNKEMLLLKKELEEKEEILEENSMTIKEMTLKMENLWKMNDALKSLVEADEEVKETKANRLEIKQANIEVKQANLEVNSLKKEIENHKKDNYNLAQKILGLEKIRETLTKENRELQEEIKLREESVFEQDDELQKKANEIRHLKNQIETITREFELTKENLAEAKRRETAGTSGRLGAQIAENERLRAELNNTIRDLKTSNQKCADQSTSMREAKEKVEAIRNEMERANQMMREKDSCVIDLNKKIRTLTSDLNSVNSELKLTNEKLESKDSQIQVVEEKLKAGDKEIVELKKKIDELTNSKANEIKPITVGKQESDSCTSSLPPNAGTMGRRSEIERLKRELLSVKRDRDEIIKDAKRERIHLEQKVSALIERQRETERGSMTNLSGSILNLATGDAYTRALATQATATKITLLNEHVMRQNRYAMELKVQNESLHNSVLDYQRKYRSLKEQYDAEQEAWLSERVMLESMSREQEDRRTTLANTKRTIQQMHIQLSEQEAAWFREKMELEEKINKLEKENNTFKSKIVAMEEQQKLPKVLQRFGANSGRMNNPIANAGNNSSALQTDLQRRLEISERSLQRLRTETTEKFEDRTKEHIQIINRYEYQRIEMERENSILKEQLVDMETFRQQAELFCQRQREIEEIADREFKLWSEEREQLLLKYEDAKVCADQWYQRLANRKNSEVQNPDDIVGEVVVDMEKWKSSKSKSYIKRRTSQGFGGSTFDQMNGCGSVPASPAANWNRSMLSYSQLSSAQRSTSMEWFNRMNSQSGLGGGATNGSNAGGPGSLLSQSYYKGSALSLLGSNGQSGLAASANYASLQRCGRSVSPDISVKKITNYPDPTAGFLLKSQSRQASTESLNSDYTGRAFTLPGKPSQKLPISPARRKFFENDEPNNQVDTTPKETPYDVMSRSVTRTRESSIARMESTDSAEKKITKVTVIPSKPEEKTAAPPVEPKRTKSKSPFSLGKSTSSLSLKPSSRASSIVNKLSSKFSHSKSSLAVANTDSSKPPTVKSTTPPKVANGSSSDKPSTKPTDKTPSPTKEQVNTSKSIIKLQKDTKLVKKTTTKSEPEKKQEEPKPEKTVKVVEPSPRNLRSSSITTTKSNASSNSSSSGTTEEKKAVEPRRGSRAGSVSGISPSIMHLRQKFSGTAASNKK